MPQFERLFAQYAQVDKLHQPYGVVHTVAVVLQAQQPALQVLGKLGNHLKDMLASGRVVFPGGLQ